MSEPLPRIAAPEHPQLALPPAPPPPPPARSRHKTWLYILLALIVAIGAVFWLRSGSAKAGAKSTKTLSGKAGRGGAPGPVPVITVQAVTGNIGVYVTGLGAITPLNTVTVRSRVDGQLLAVHFKEGDYVQKGQPLIEIDPRPYEAVVTQAEGQLVRDQALLANAKVDQARYQTLLAQDAIPEQQLTTQKALVTQYEGTVKNDEGLLQAARLNVTYSHIAAPISGIVGLRLVDPGNIVHAADTNGMAVIAQLQPISLIFPVGEDQLPAILPKFRAGQKLTVEAWDREMKNKLASGVLSTVDNQIDQTTGTLKLRALFNNDNRALFPNQFVNARLLQQEKRGVTLLQSAAIQRNTNETYVYLVKPDSTVTVRKITLGVTEGDQAEVTSGLSTGDTVVMTGVDKLQEGSKVAAAKRGETQTPQ